MAAIPPYIRVHKAKHSTPFSHLFVAQTTSPCPGDALWCLKFSTDGKYLATAGKSKEIILYKIIALPLDHVDTHSDLNLQSPKSEEEVSYPLLFDRPRYFIGHEHDVLALDWLKNGFIVLALADKSARLWHPSRPGNPCLGIYPHTDFVTCIAFHPTDDRFFASGLLDTHLRLWLILDKSVCFENTLPAMITACAFVPKGDVLLAGTITGVVYGFETKGLYLKFQFDLRKGYVKGSGLAKIQGLECFDHAGDVRVLVTTADSRIRTYLLGNLRVIEKYKGLEARTVQGTAAMSEDQKYVAMGMGDRSVHLWAIGAAPVKHGFFRANAGGAGDKVRNPELCTFTLPGSGITELTFVPERAKRLLVLLNDPLYDLASNLGHTDFLKTPDMVLCDSSGSIKVLRVDPIASERGSSRHKYTEKKPRDSFEEGELTLEGSLIDTTSNGNTEISGDPVRRRFMSGLRSFSKDDQLAYLQSLNSSSASIGADTGTFQKPMLTKNNSLYSMGNGSISSLLRGRSYSVREDSPLVCDVCQGTKFATSKKNLKGTSMTVRVCQDCGNEMN